MLILVLACASVALAWLAFTPEISWVCIAGFVIGVSIWVLARKMIATGADCRYAKASMIIGGVGTFGNLAAIFFSFVLGSILYGGLVVF